MNVSHPPAFAKFARRAAWGLLFLTLGACEKVPLIDVNAGFALADATWFEAEQTLFVFYSVEAEQGLGPLSVIEVTWRTDVESMPWTRLDQISPVHIHLPMSCGPRSLCGSMSMKVSSTPRMVGIRLRYHRESALTLEAPVVLNLVSNGPAWSNRSLLVYGVFDETNTQVEWRSRNQFPTLRNAQAGDLGLRRAFKVTGAMHGDVGAQRTDNPYSYGYAAACSGVLTPLGWQPAETIRRAIFQPERLDFTGEASKGVCANATVTDALGTFDAPVVARKNPDVRAAFPELRSPIKPNTEVGFLLRPCAKTISEPHRLMQVQRLLLGGDPQFCIDTWQDVGFVDQLAQTFKQAIDKERLKGKDMVLAIALHHDDTTGEFTGAVEKALLQILPFERDKSSPHVSGAFVFDSGGYNITNATVKRLTLWCPAKINITDLDLIPGASELSCPIIPDLPDIKLGPFKFGTLPILPTRAQYLTFIGKYSEAQAGVVRELEFLAPERTPLSQNVSVGDFAIATFFNNEIITAAPTDAFSFCAGGDPSSSVAVFRTPFSPDPFPLGAIGQFHSLAPQPSYSLGLLWTFPFLLTMKYEMQIAGAATVFSFTVPFGTGVSGTQPYGTGEWKQSTFKLGNTLKQCTRFCDHPTFDPAGVYNVLLPFNPTFASQCYGPKFPTPLDQGNPGFPLDP